MESFFKSICRCQWRHFCELDLRSSEKQAMVGLFLPTGVNGEKAAALKRGYVNKKKGEGRYGVCNFNKVGPITVNLKSNPWWCTRSTGAFEAERK